MKHILIPFLVGSTLVLSSCKETPEKTSQQQPKPEITQTVKLNQIQVLGTHNSYAKPIDSAVTALVDPIFNKLMGQYVQNMDSVSKQKFKEYHPNEMSFSQGLNYSHPDFITQLNAGLRSLEIDVFNDPTGNRFNSPAAYQVLKNQGINDLANFDTTDLSKPGFKVMHVADIDFRTHYPTFKKALEALNSWSNQNPKHTPIFIMIEAKDSGIPLFPNSAEVMPFDETAFDALDQEVISILGKDKLITPDDVRGKFKTLEEAVLANNWPLLEDAKGKFVFMLLPSAGGMSAESEYVKNHTVLENRVMFVQSQIGQPHAAFLLLDNAIVRQDDIKNAVKKGYLVRTRSDIETYEAKINDTTRAHAAFTSGAQVISTDFFRPGNNYGTDYFVKMPNGKPMRLNPVNSNNIK
ncbi:PLC-like phosphodiesterase, TIM beta/alpha-barre l domain [Formosa agariphila KMM 3901]|uniref:PLC-like phosphodiesterase, TIM beta/alpha-barre l domain n=1 Tax=Formosa agariphila (strain DSM 15362 / KCTC 12365 / LMG 23005 / KMM 3901 / M-2Alg 35-1) TaxID=1347342 RepID=T2KIE4_FORAG|nr:Ca2+-dependent phosphoinositide-specific phospholipase C [Formosa agariphila]CDF78642.1 PLC-like phosphodiesterase, TIM beta/alpha-barre l domain [Formosa agariphila KMM 3901]